MLSTSLSLLLLFFLAILTISVSTLGGLALVWTCSFTSQDSAILVVEKVVLLLLTVVAVLGSLFVILSCVQEVLTGGGFNAH